MNIAIILEHFRYFLEYGSEDKLNNYYFLTARQKYIRERIPNLMYCDTTSTGRTNRVSVEGDWENYFKVLIKLNPTLNPKDIKHVASLYEQFFGNFYEQHKIDLVICGGTTGFERCGIFIAKKLGIKTLCTWEGYYRPCTMSVDKDGLNAESAFYKNSFESIVTHVPSVTFNSFLPQYLGKVTDEEGAKRSLFQVQNKRFVLHRQLRNRWRDRNDYERIRLPFQQHGIARLHYYINKNKYISLREINRPFIFFPLQTHTDSNVILNSELYPYARYVRCVIEAFLQIQHKLGYNLIIKEHPYDVFRTWYPWPNSEHVLWIKPEISTWQILSNMNCAATIVVNSTVGFESLLLQKPVLALGRSVYAHKELVVIPENNDPESLAHAIETVAVNQVDSTQCYVFAASLYDTMQIEGSIDSIPKKEEMDHFIKTYMNS